MNFGATTAGGNNAAVERGLRINGERHRARSSTHGAKKALVGSAGVPTQIGGLEKIGLPGFSRRDQVTGGCFGDRGRDHHHAAGTHVEIVVVIHVVVHKARRLGSVFRSEGRAQVRVDGARRAVNHGVSEKVIRDWSTILGSGFLVGPASVSGGERIVGPIRGGTNAGRPNPGAMRG